MDRSGRKTTDQFAFTLMDGRPGMASKMPTKQVLFMCTCSHFLLAMKTHELRRFQKIFTGPYICHTARNMTNPVPSVVQSQNSHRSSLDSILGESMWDLWWTKLYWDRIYFSMYVRCQLPLHHCAIFIHSSSEARSSDMPITCRNCAWCLISH